MAGRWPILAGWRGVGGHREACRGLAVDRRGRAWPWPWLAAASSGAATEPRQASVAGSGSCLQVTARPRGRRRGATRGQEEEDKVGWGGRMMVAGRPWSSTPCPWWPLEQESGERRWGGRGSGEASKE